MTDQLVIQPPFPPKAGPTRHVTVIPINRDGVVGGGGRSPGDEEQPPKSPRKLGIVIIPLILERLKKIIHFHDILSSDTVLTRMQQTLKRAVQSFLMRTVTWMAANFPLIVSNLQV